MVVCISFIDHILVNSAKLSLLVNFSQSENGIRVLGSPLSKRAAFFYEQKPGEYFKIDDSGDFLPLIIDQFLFFREIEEARCDGKLVVYLSEYQKKVFVYRDSFGIVPAFYLHVPGEFIVLSDKMPEIVEFARSQKGNLTVNLEKLVPYLNHEDLSRAYSEDTFFNEIKSVLPGYGIEVCDGKILLNRYLTFETDRWKDLPSFESYGDAFREIFSESVAKCVPPSGKVAGQLSGGLDSSSALSMVRHLYPLRPLVSLYIDYSGKRSTDYGNLNDDYYASVVARELGTEHKTIEGCNADLEALECLLEQAYQPPLMMGNHCLLRKLLQTAQSLEIDSLVTGYDGDSIVGYGDEYIKDLLEEGNWKTLGDVLLSNPILKEFPDKRKPYLLRFVVNHLTGVLKKKRLGDLPLLLFKAYRYLGVNPFAAMRGLVKKGTGKLFGSYISGSVEPMIKKDIDKEILKIVGGKTAAINTFTGLSLKEIDYFGILCNHNIRIVEEYYALSDFFKIEVKFPFFYKELYELCLAIPSKWNFSNGLGRGILRVGLEGILPDPVRSRMGKTVGKEEYLREKALSLISNARDYISPESPIWHYIDYDSFQYNLNLLESNKLKGLENKRLISKINRIVYAAVWLKKCF